ncbi:MAG: peptidylprolyl isomerase [bacterium]
MHKFSLFIISLTILSASSFAGEADKIVAVVNDDVITQSELDNYFKISKLLMGVEKMPNPRLEENLLEERLNALVNYALVDNMPESLSYLRIDQSEIQKENLRILEEFASEMFGEEATIDTLKSYFENAGLEWELSMRLMEKELMYNAVTERYLAFNYPELSNFQKFNVDDEELLEFYQKIKDSLRMPLSYHLSRIVLSPNPSEQRMMQINRKANQVLKALSEGEDFRSIASIYSEDKETAANGGYLGIVHRGDMLPEVENSIFSIEPGNMGVIQSMEGIHILYVPTRWADSARVYQIFISMLPNSEDSLRVLQELDSVTAKLDRGEDFAQVARIYSDDPYSREQGGDVGNVPVDSMDVSLLSILTMLEPGEYTSPIQSPFGYVIFKLHEVNLGEPVDFQEAKEQLKQNYFLRQRQQVINRWIDSLKQQLYFEQRTIP